ncbi:hypothetical protein EBT16_04200, partial [bacterium]|nr:hypothetical protein [bacterium]
LPTLRDLSFASGSTSFNPTPTVNFRLNKSANVSLFLGACSDEFEISQKENKQGDGSIESIQVTQSFTLDGSYPVLIQAQLGDKKGDCVKVGDYLFDTERPTVSLSSSAPFLLNGPFLVTATFSESITGLEANDIFVDGGTVSGSPSVVSGTNYKQYRFTVAPLAQGLITVRVASNSAIDSAGNFNLVSENLTRNHDSVRPSVVLSSTATEYVNSSYPVKAVFSESVSGLLLSDLQVTGGTASGLNELPGTDSKEYEFTINPSVEGDVTVTVGSDSAFDAATNGNSASNSLLRVHDTLSPTVSITSSAPTYVNGPFQAKAVFSEPVTGFTPSGIELTQASASGITGVPETYVTGYGFREYTFTVTPSQEGQVNLSIKAGAVSDRVGNPNSASGTPLTRTYDITRPALVSLTSASSLLVNAPFVISLEFDEPMGSVESSDLVLSQGSASAPTEVPGSNGTRWQFTISPNQQGSISVSILTNGANDLAGNGVLASGETVTRTFDNVNPSVTLSSPANPYVNAPFTVIAEFSEVVNGFTLSDVSVTRANLGSLQTLETDKKFQFTVTPTSEGTVSLNVIASGVTDPTGNTNTASTSLTRVYDTTRPSVTLSSSSSQNVNGPFLVVATFSESMASFDSNALSVSGGSTSAPAAISGTNNQQWEFTITPQLSGSVTVQVLVNTAPDLAGNFNTASALLSRTFDETAPVISAIALTPSASPTNETNLKVDFSVNEVATLALHNGSLCTSPLSGTLSLVSGAQSLTTYSLPDGTYSVYVRAQDQAGNVSCTVAKASHLVDTTAPQNGSISITNANPTNSNSLSLALWAEDATAIQMQVSLTDLATPTCSGTWESFSASKIVTIPELLKNKTVYADVRYRDAVLNQTSCLRTQIVHDNLPPADPSAITINDGAAVTNSSGVTVKVTSGDAPYGVALSQNTSFCTNDSFLVTWVAFGAASTKSLSHTLTILNATNTVYARVRDQAGNISGCVSSSIIHSNTAPINPGISIESGAARTNKTQVTLTLSMTPSGSNDIEMYITNTSGCSAGGTWADYSATALHTLSPLNQTTTVYVKYRDKLAPYFETDCVSDSIYHDNIAPLGTGISLNSGEAATPYPWISIYLHSSMQEDPWSEYQMNVFESSDCTGSSLTGGWTYYYDWLGYNVPYAKLNTQLYFSAKFRDLTGNETVCASATILHDDRQPYISYIDKASGPLAGGVSATIAGGNFRSGAEASVYFGSRKATCSLVGAP